MGLNIILGNLQMISMCVLTYYQFNFNNNACIEKKKLM